MLDAVTLAHGYGFLLVLFRMAALVAVAPILGDRVVPNRIRVALALAGAMVAYLGAGTPALSLPNSFLALMGNSLAESALGLSAGLGARLTLQAATGAGQMVSQGMGLGYASTLDPLVGVESTMVGEIFSNVTIMFAVAYGLHREAFAWLAQSVHQIPPGAAGASFHHLVAGVITQAIASTSLAVRMGFPILIAVTFGNMAMAVISRVAPQVNLQTIGFSFTICVGGGALYVLLPQIASGIARALLASFSLSA